MKALAILSRDVPRSAHRRTWGGGVAKQKCGTCRFFQEANLAGSGWCHHPQRKVSSDVMIMVRRNELACRDEWSRSLWTPAEAGLGTNEPAFLRPQNQGPMPPADAAELLALAQISERELPHVVGEDVLLSEARLVAEPQERGLRQPIAASSSPGFDVRSAVFRAREAYKERNRARDIAVRKSGGATPLQETFEEHRSATAERSDLTVSLSDEALRQIAGGVQAPDSAPPFEADFALGSAMDRSGVSTPPATSELDDIGTGSTSAIETFVSVDNSLSWFFETTPAESEEAFKETPAPELQLTELHRFSSEPLPVWFRTELPRMCRTCRDYRPTADGRRGWCANAWAFTHARLVNEDDVTPCDSAFGDWWAAVDDVWLVAADVSNHSRPTPLLDRMVALKSPTKSRSQGTS